MVNFDQGLIKLFAATRRHRFDSTGTQGTLPRHPLLSWQHTNRGSLMKPNFPIFLAAALLLGTASAEAAHQKAARNNPSRPPPASAEAAHQKAARNNPSRPPPASSVPTTPHTNPIGGIGTSQSFPPISSAPLTPPNPIEDAPTLNTQTFGGLPGAPTYNPFAVSP
jgi:hypothetical protein